MVLMKYVDECGRLLLHLVVSDQVLRREYGDLLVAPLEGYNVTLSLDFNTQLPKGETSDAWQPLVRKIAMLKRNCFAAVFEKYFEYQAKPESASHRRAVIHYRDDETMYVDASADRVVVIFSTVFKDADDNVIGRVFMEVGNQKNIHSSLTFGVLSFSLSLGI